MTPFGVSSTMRFPTDCAKAWSCVVNNTVPLNLTKELLIAVMDSNRGDWWVHRVKRHWHAASSYEIAYNALSLHLRVHLTFKGFFPTEQHFS